MSIKIKDIENEITLLEKIIKDQNRRLGDGVPDSTVDYIEGVIYGLNMVVNDLKKIIENQSK
jgi:hypothetical protein